MVRFFPSSGLLTGSRSSAARTKSAGPSVISKYCSEGGYFSQLINESQENVSLGCGSQGVGSPYQLKIRSTKNAAQSVPPSTNSLFRRRQRSCKKSDPKP